MKASVSLFMLVAAATACGRPTSPTEAANSGDRFAILAPASASVDFGAMFTEAGAQQWPESRSQLRAFQFYQQSLRNDCPTCGPNRLSDFVGARSEGAFAWLTNQGIQIGVEAGSVKEHTCDGRELGRVVLADMGPIYGAGSHVTFIAMDEPFTAGLPGPEGPTPERCNFDIDRTVIEVKAFTDTVHATYPSIRIGLIEPYPYFTVAELTSFIVALENAGVRQPFFRLDFDLRHRRNTNSNTSADLKHLNNFLRDRGIEFELIVTGYDGRTDAGAVASAMALAHEVRGLVGRPHAVVFQDWSADKLGRGTRAVNLPEHQVGSLTWLVNHGLEVFR